MKSVLVIGMGRFGRHLAKRMLDLGNDVMIVDSNEKLIGELSATFEDSQIGDCTNENVIKSLGVDQFDICFVTIGEDFQSSLVITSLLKKYNAKFVMAKANQDIQADLLKKIGADEIVYPEKETANRLAVRYNAKNVFDYIPLTSEFSLYEIPIIRDWAGKTIFDIDVRKKYKVNIIAVKKGNSLQSLPGADYRFDFDDHIVVIGASADVFKLTSKT
ncbi:MAG: TrkA family potassium uptake protein [Ruminococcus sp.]|nr:TrkA family potassium uptake protein [Oscillospiraceae bacterium]MDY4414201.1 TrkA family potassium uptake protein [Ruminococcus sp.]